MSERALVAYERPDGRYNCHYAHWGATDGLDDRLTPATPFGGAEPRAEWAAGVLRDLLTATDAEAPRVASRTPDDAATAVDPAPLAVAVPLEALPDHVVYGSHEALFLVDRSFGVTAFVAVSFDLASVAAALSGIDIDPEAGGALVPVDAGTSVAALRERAAGAREALGAAIDHVDGSNRGCTPAVARAALHETLVRWVGADRLLVADGDHGRTGAGA
ncbi:DUF6735 family protein [Haloglomus salinum]|uniref:DUF6735 family protein n=1 Tax=Haloglomus salinum TaxID=2962673 RepID=UPI0020C9A169|nr:DUF6735 family protein [Haloglomus salinum]